MTFQELYERICDALCGNRSAPLMEVLLPDRTHRIIRQKKSPDGSGSAQTGADPA